MSRCVLDCSRYCCYADRQVPLFQVDIRRIAGTALGLRVKRVSSSPLLNFVTADMKGVNVSAWQIGKGG